MRSESDTLEVWLCRIVPKTETCRRMQRSFASVESKKFYVCARKRCARMGKQIPHIYHRVADRVTEARRWQTKGMRTTHPAAHQPTAASMDGDVGIDHPSREPAWAVTRGDERKERCDEAVDVALTVAPS